jgi:hypothetical protein
MWGGPAKIKNISRYSYIKVCNAAKLIPAGIRSIFLYTRIFLYQVFLYPGLTVDTKFTRQTGLLVQTAVFIIYKRTRLVQTSWNISHLVRFLLYKNPYDLVCTAVQTVNWQTTGHTDREYTFYTI